VNQQIPDDDDVRQIEREIYQQALTILQETSRGYLTLWLNAKIGKCEAVIAMSEQGE
jgi:hypothetical protein